MPRLDSLEWLTRMPFDFQRQADELRPHEKRFILSPQQWAQYQPITDLVWQIVRFGTDQANSVPGNTRGVYTFVVQPGIANHNWCSYLLYVGKTTEQTFRKRFRQYLRERRDPKTKRPHITDMLTRWDGYLWFCYAEMTDKAAIVQTEDSLQKAYLPPFNKEFPAEIRDALKVLR